MAGAEVQRMVVQLDLEGNASAGINKLNRQISGFGKGVGRMGKGVGQVGGAFAKAGLVLGGAAITGITAVAKAAIDFEDAFAGVRKTVNATNPELDAMALQFRDLATKIPVAATDLARIGETAGALGIGKKDIVAFTEVVAKLSETTNLTADAAAEDLGKVGTILGLHGKQFQTFADTLVNLGNQGASTESEIIEVTKRFAAMGKQAGLTSNQILALSSAATSLGAEPEAAGSALSRIFGNMSKEIANGSAKGKEFAKVTGKSITTLKRMINRGQGLPILLDTLKGISKMSRTQAASTLKALGITNVRDVNTILLMSQNLEFVNDQLRIADHSQGALGKEFSKRMATTAAKVKLLGNNVKEAAITVGNEFLPSVQKKIGEIIDVLQKPGTKSNLKDLGKDIAKAIDGINVQEVIDKAGEFVDILRGAVGVARQMYDIFNALPGPIKEATAAFLAVNKLSGGLLGTGVGNIIGGLGETIAKGLGSRLPGVGKLFAQPVIVTNWPPGFGAGGGVPGAGGAASKGIGALGKVFLIGEAIGLVTAVNDVRTAVEGDATQQAQGITSAVSQLIASDPSRAQLETALAGVNQGIKDLKSDPLGVILVSGGALSELEKQQAALTAAIDALKPKVTPSKQTPAQQFDALTGQRRGERGRAETTGKSHDAAWQKLRQTQLETRRETSRGLNATKASVDDTKTAINTMDTSVKGKIGTELSSTRGTVRTSALAGASITAGATATWSAAIIAAIFAARPVVNVTNVQSTINKTVRYGATSGSRGSNKDSGGNTIGH